MENEFYKICYDCLYYGYFKKFIFNKYPEWIEFLGIEKATKIYQKAFNNICEEK